MPYICADCMVFWPCLNAEHADDWRVKQWFPVASEYSMACFVFDHEHCPAPRYCKCACHTLSILDEAISVPPSNR